MLHSIPNKKHSLQVRYFKVAIPLQLITSPKHLQGDKCSYTQCTEVGERSAARNGSSVSRATALRYCKDFAGEADPI